MLAEKSADLILGKTPLAPEHVEFYRHATARTKPEHRVEHPLVPAQESLGSVAQQQESLPV